MAAERALANSHVLRILRRQWGRGRVAAERAGRRPAAILEESVNGAAAEWPRNAGAGPMSGKSDHVRQWGRGRVAAERICK